jgi:hypothetical protein
LSGESDCQDTLSAKIGNLDGMDARRTKMADMRAFLWKHWHEQKCGVLLFTTVSKEGKASHAEYKIRLVPPSTWVLEVRFVRDRYGHNEVIPRVDQNAGYEAYAVERIATTNPNLEWKTEAKVLRDDEDVPSVQYLLRFKDWEGFPITYF